MGFYSSILSIVGGSKNRMIIEEYDFEIDGERGSVNLFQDSLKIHISPEVYVFDLEGRPIFVYYDGILYERGLSNEFVAKKWIDFNPPRRYLERVRDPEKKRRIVERAHRPVKYLLNFSLPYKIRGILEKIIAYDYMKLEQESKIFYRIYKPISILPPDQYLALVLQPVEGCPYNKCSFCTFYRDRRFRYKSIEEFRKHVENVLTFIGKGILIRRRIFLADANALVAPISLLKQYISIIYEYIPREDIAGIHSFMDYFTVRKDVDDFIWLKNNGLRMVYIGLETGNPELLKILNKPGPPERAIEIVKKLKEAGVNVGVIVLIGAGGESFYNYHVRDTIKVLNEMPLDSGDIIYFSKLKVSPGSEYMRLSMKFGLKELSEYDMDRQIIEVRKGIRHSDKPIMAIYDIDEFVY